MGSSGGGMSQSEIYAIQEKARADAEAKVKAEQEQAQRQAQQAADAGTGDKVGGGSDGYEGALADANGKKGKKGSTLTGEGEATFTPKAGKLGE